MQKRAVSLAFSLDVNTCLSEGCLEVSPLAIQSEIRRERHVTAFLLFWRISTSSRKGARITKSDSDEYIVHVR